MDYQGSSRGGSDGPEGKVHLLINQRLVFLTRQDVNIISILLLATSVSSVSSQLASSLFFLFNELFKTHPSQCGLHD